MLGAVVAVGKAVWIAVLLSSLLSASAANAAFATGGFCSLNSDTGGIGQGDVTLNGGQADDCYGLVSIGGNVAGEINNINQLGWGTFSATNYLKDDKDADSVTASFLGLDWELAADNKKGSGSWVLTVTDPDLVNAPNLPIVVDIIAFMKAGTPGAFYFFDDVLIDTSNDGTFSISWKNGGGQTPGLSGFSLFFGEVTTTRVPEPGSVALLGLALAGVGFATRRRRD